MESVSEFLIEQNDPQGRELTSLMGILKRFSKMKSAQALKTPKFRAVLDLAKAKSRSITNLPVKAMTGGMRLATKQLGISDNDYRMLVKDTAKKIKVDGVTYYQYDKVFYKKTDNPKKTAFVIIASPFKQ